MGTSSPDFIGVNGVQKIGGEEVPPPQGRRPVLSAGYPVRYSSLRYGLGLEHLVCSGGSAICRRGAADNVYPAAAGIDTSLLPSRSHGRVGPGVVGDIVHLV